MAGHMNAGQTLFTVEQIELLRRLRNSGISKEQLVQAFDSFERLDRELGHIYTIPMSLAAAGMPFPGMLNMRPMMTPLNMSQAAQAVSQAMSKLAAAAQTPPQMPSRKRSHDDDPSEASTPELPTQPLAQPQPQPQPQTNGIHSLPYISNGAEEVLDEIEDSDEFREFISKGEIPCCEEIRNFVIKYNIKQQQVAVLSGISQSYVSRYFKGDHYDMSERSRRAIKKWYVIFKNNPAAVGPAAHTAMLSAPPTPAKLQKIAEQTTVNEFVNYPRRERFVFRPAHLQVLERYFQDDSYPSQEKRDEISRSCNAVVEIPAGRPLVERETVTPQIVSNWFANKRKEMKKLAREEGLEISPMRSRGRPARFSMDLMAAMMQENSQGMHMTLPHGMGQGENSNHGSNLPTLSSDSQTPTPATPSQDSAPPTPPETAEDEPIPTPPKPFPASQSQSTPQSQGSESPSPVITPNQPVPLTPTSSEVSTSLNLEAADDQSLSLAVEMAAVNQAIIALSGQSPIGIKTERIEPENVCSIKPE